MIGRQVAVSSKLEHAKAKCKTMGESCSGVEEYELENGSRTYKLQLHSRLVLKSDVIASVPYNFCLSCPKLSDQGFQDVPIRYYLSFPTIHR